MHPDPVMHPNPVMYPNPMMYSNQGNPMMFPNFPSDRVVGMNHPGTNNATPRMNVIAKAPSATTVCNDDRIVSKFVLQKQNLIVHLFVKSYIGHSDTVRSNLFSLSYFQYFIFSQKFKRVL